MLPAPHGFGGVVQSESVPLPALRQLHIGWVVMDWEPSMTDDQAKAMVANYAGIGQTNVLICKSLEQCYKAKNWGAIVVPFNEPDESANHIAPVEYAGIVRQLARDGVPVAAPGASTPNAARWLADYYGTGVQAPYKAMHGYFVPISSLLPGVIYSECGPYLSGMDFVSYAVALYKSGLTAAIFQVVDDGMTPCLVDKNHVINANGKAFLARVAAGLH